MFAIVAQPFLRSAIHLSALAVHSTATTPVGGHRLLSFGYHSHLGGGGERPWGVAAHSLSLITRPQCESSK